MHNYGKTDEKTLHNAVIPFQLNHRYATKKQEGGAKDQIQKPKDGPPNKYPPFPWSLFNIDCGVSRDSGA